MGRILRKLEQLRTWSFDRGDRAVESERGVENVDALAATGGRQSPDPTTPIHGAPPGYVKPDDGRPRH